MSFNISHIANDKIGTEIVGSKVESLKYNKDSLPTSHYSPDFFQPRDTGSKILYIDHSSIGVFEQSLGFRNTLDVSVTLSIRILVNAGDGDKTGSTLWTGTLPPDARFFFAPDRSDSVVEMSINKIVGLVELRLPYNNFVLTINPATAPTQGEIMVQCIRRY